MTDLSKSCLGIFDILSRCHELVSGHKDSPAWSFVPRGWNGVPPNSIISKCTSLLAQGEQTRAPPRRSVCLTSRQRRLVCDTSDASSAPELKLGRR
jgi:hypothetical protein